MKLLVLFVAFLSIYEISGASLHWRRNSGLRQFIRPPQFVGPPQWNPYFHPRSHHDGQPPKCNETTTESDDGVTESSSVSSSEPSTASSSEAPTSAR